MNNITNPSNRTGRVPSVFRTILADPPWDIGEKGRFGASAVSYTPLTLPTRRLVLVSGAR